MDFSFLDDWADEEAGPQIAEGGEGYRNIWVFAEMAKGALCASSLEVMGQARDLADQIGRDAAEAKKVLSENKQDLLVSCSADLGVPE